MKDSPSEWRGRGVLCAGEQIRLPLSSPLWQWPRRESQRPCCHLGVLPLRLCVYFPPPQTGCHLGSCLSAWGLVPASFCSPQSKVIARSSVFFLCLRNTKYLGGRQELFWTCYALRTISIVISIAFRSLYFGVIRLVLKFWTCHTVWYNFGQFTVSELQCLFLKNGDNDSLEGSAN